MSEVRIDVSWRGLEVGREVALREVTATHGRIDVALPMPVGTAVMLVAGPLRVPAIVSAVHEQSTSGGETAGMVVEPTLDGDTRAWWLARAAESAIEVPLDAASSAADEPVVIVATVPADPPPAASAPAIAVPRITSPAIVVPPPVAMPPVATPPVATPPVATPGAAPASAPVAIPTPSPVAQAHAASPAETTAALTPEDLRAARFAAVADAAADLAAAERERQATAPDDDRRTEAMPALTPPEDSPDETGRTAIMSAVDVAAIIADGAAHAAEVSSDASGPVSDEDEAVPGEVSASTDVSGARGKRKSPRGKRRKTRS